MVAFVFACLAEWAAAAAECLAEDAAWCAAECLAEAADWCATECPGELLARPLDAFAPGVVVVVLFATACFECPWLADACEAPSPCAVAPFAAVAPFVAVAPFAVAAPFVATATLLT